MLARVGHLRSFAAVAIAIWISAGVAQAVEGGGRDPMSKSAQAQKMAKPAAEEDDDDDESFFSGKTNFAGKTKTAFAAVGPTTYTASVASVDIDAVCRAVLADNTNYYNYNFLEGCKRAVTQGASRRNAR